MTWPETKTNTLPEAEALWFLGLVELGIIRIATAQQPPHWGEVVYAASNGWTLCVFGDCVDWDYIEWIRCIDGRVWDFEGTGEGTGEGWTQLQNYRPAEASTDLRVYGFWGYLVNEDPNVSA